MLHQRADRRRGGFAAAVGIHVAGEEIFQFENAARAVQKLLRGNARDRRFMHLHGLGDIRQHHGFHKLFALLEERLLLADDAAGDLQQRFVAALQAFNQPLGFL